MGRPSIPMYVEFICGCCASPGHGQFLRELTKKGVKSEMIREAKSQGWVFAHSEVFCGEQCATNYIRNKRLSAIRTMVKGAIP